MVLDFPRWHEFKASCVGPLARIPRFVEWRQDASAETFRRYPTRGARFGVRALPVLGHWIYGRYSSLIREAHSRRRSTKDS